MLRCDRFDLIKGRPWQGDEAFPAGITMLAGEELLLLRWLAKNCSSAEGLLLDCGCFLGGSTISFARGLQESTSPGKKVHSFDLFMPGPFEAKAYADRGLERGKSFRPLFDQNTAAYRDLIDVHEGDITQSSMPPGDIEVLFIDCAKIPAVNDFFVTKLFPRLIPGKSIVIQQDYLYPALPWLHITMEYFSEYFEVLADTQVNSVVYGCIKPIPPKVTVGCVWNVMPRNVKHVLMQQAINRWQGDRRQFVIGAYASYDIDKDENRWSMAPP